jgi:hypothetical protein
MHHLLKGALGAALVYPLAWYYYSQPEALQPVATSASRPAMEKRVEQNAKAALDESGVSRGAVPGALAERAGATAAEASPSSQRQPARPPELAVPGAQETAKAPDVVNREVPFPEFAELQATLAQMKELQRHAHDPQELDARVQSMESDPQKLAKLRAMAELLVKLPPSRSDAYLPAEDPSP